MLKHQRKKQTPQEAARLFRMLAGVYVFGMVLGVALSFLPLMRGNISLWGIAAILGLAAALNLLLARHVLSKGR